MSLEHAIGSALNAFSRTKLIAENADRDKDLRKAQTKLFEIQLEQAQAKNDALGRIDERMNPVSELVQGAPAQSPSGRDIPQFESAQQPQGLLDMLIGGDSAAQSDLIQGGLASADNFIPKPQGQPEFLQILDAFGIDTDSPEALGFLEQKLGGNTDLKDLMAGLNIQLGQDKIATNRIEREKVEKTERERIAGTKV